MVKDMDMEENSIKETLKELLDRLAVESWQLELVVSGFAIFLVGSSLEPIKLYGSRLFVISEGVNSDFNALPVIASILFASAFFVFINLILHIVFRGMWISAIGLRSISGEIDFSELKFARPFDTFLRKRLKSFDAFIKRLDDICSVIFAFTFLIVFMLVSIGLFFLYVGSVVYVLKLLEANTGFGDALGIVRAVVIVTFLISGFLYFLDFITLGFLKRKRWIAVWYFPIYRLFSFVTFSWLYRPLYYNLIDNKFGRRIGLFLFPYFILVGGLASLSAKVNLFIPEDKDGLLLIDRYFADKRDKDSRIVDMSIPSMYIKNGYLELFLLYYASNDDESIAVLCPDLTPDMPSGLGSDLEFNINGGDEGPKYHSPADSILNCLSSNFEIKINDSIYQELDFYFYEDPVFEQEGIKTVIDVNHLKRGKHQLRVKRYEVVKKDSVALEPFASTPFWKQ